jgi:hypothetical protein
MAAHRDQPAPLLQIGYFLGIAQRIGKRDFDLNMFAGVQTGDRLGRVHLRRRA